MLKKILPKIGIFLLILFWLLSGWPPIWQNPRTPPKIQLVYAAVSITQVTGGSSISADTTGGAYTTLTGPTISEGSNGDIKATGTIVLTAPSGFNFSTGSTVTATISKLNSSTRNCFTFTSTTATPTATTITFTSATADGTGGSPALICKVVFSNIQVRPTAGTPLASGNITNTGTNTGVASGANFGPLAEVVGAKNKLAVTTQPSTTATVNTNFTTKPVVTLQDQYGNTVTTDSTSTVTEAVVLSTQSCGGTAGSGSLTSTPTSGSAVSSGVMTYTAMQYSVGESIKICFSSTGVTSALSNTVTVVALPTVTTQAASSVKDATATANGNITATGNENADKQGFVYDTLTHTLPGNVAPASSGYASSIENTGSFGTGAFTVSLTGLTGGTTYYGRSYAHNSAGYSYGGEVSFTTAVISISITSDGTVSYGIVAAGASKNTTASGLNDTQSAQNGSTIAENFNIKTSNATGGTQWSLGATPGSDIFVHEFSTNGGGVWTKFTTADSYQTLVTGIAALGTQNFDLRITVPSSTTDYQQKTITVTVQAVAQ